MHITYILTVVNFDQNLNCYWYENGGNEMLSASTRYIFYACWTHYCNENINEHEENTENTVIILKDAVFQVIIATSSRLQTYLHVPTHKPTF